MYGLRSDILHGTALMQHDQYTAFGWDPPLYREGGLHNELWMLTRLAIRHWLNDWAPDPSTNSHQHQGRLGR